MSSYNAGNKRTVSACSTAANTSKLNALDHSIITMEEDYSRRSDASSILGRRSTMDPSLNFSSFMRTMEADRRDQTRTSNESLSLEEATGNDTNNSRLLLEDLPSERHWGSGFLDSFRKRMGSSKLLNFSFRRSPSDTSERDVSEKQQRKVRFKFF